LAALEIKVSLFVQFTQVTGSQPSIFAGYRPQLAAPVTGRYVIAAHKDFAALVQLHFVARKRLANRPATQVEGVIYGDQGGSLGHPVSLDDCEAKSAPESFRLV